MKRRRILYGLTMLIVVLSISVALALVPPPPANQDLGIYDTLCKEFSEDDCRACHNSSVPDTHHLLVRTGGGYGCMDCHQVKTDPEGSTGVGVIRNCVACHVASPHHETQAAVDRQCSYCHGSVVDDYDDGHSIPTYMPSLVTPDTSYAEKDGLTGQKLGGCEACHEPDSTAVPPIYSNRDTHHNLGNLSFECDMCHEKVAGDENLLNIRKCQDCHGTKSLHNIQYNYTDTKGQLGFGHVGANWDCLGCHGGYSASSLPPQTGPIIPSIDQVDPISMVAGVGTVVTITGNNFENTVNGVYYTSEVAIVDDAGTITVTSDTITATQIVATIPALDSGSYGLRVVKSGMNSNLVPIVVVPQVTIDSTMIRMDAVTIRGSGFGDELGAPYDELFGVTITCEGNALVTNIVTWDDTRIVVDCPSAVVGDEVTVTTLYGCDSATIG